LRYRDEVPALEGIACPRCDASLPGEGSFRYLRAAELVHEAWIEDGVRVVAYREVLEYEDDDRFERSVCAHA